MSKYRRDPSIDCRRKRLAGKNVVEQDLERPRLEKIRGRFAERPQKSQGQVGQIRLDKFQKSTKHLLRPSVYSKDTKSLVKHHLGSLVPSARLPINIMICPLQADGCLMKGQASAHIRAAGGDVSLQKDFPNPVEDVE